MQTNTAARYAIVIETTPVIGKSKRHVRRFDSRREAFARLDTATKRAKGDIFKRVYMVDTVLQPHVIL